MALQPSVLLSVTGGVLVPRLWWLALGSSNSNRKAVITEQLAAGKTCPHVVQAVTALCSNPNLLHKVFKCLHVNMFAVLLQLDSMFVRAAYYQIMLVSCNLSITRHM